MFTFIKKLFGFDQETMRAAGVQTEQAPYKLPEPSPAPTLLSIEIVPVAEAMVPITVSKVEEPETAPVVSKPARKPRAPKTSAAKTVVKKAAPVKKAAAIKTVRKVK